MAKKSNFSSSRMDESNYDDLDIPDFDFDDAPKQSKNRKPVAVILDDVKKGVKQSVFNRANIKKAIRKALPEGYGEALDFKDEVAASAKELYDKAAKEVRPSLKDLARATTKLVPENARRTKSALNSINKWFDKDLDYGYKGEDKGKAADHTVASTLAEIFKFQMGQGVKDNADKDNKESIKDGVEALRSRTQIGLLNSISLGVSRLAQYQDKVNVAFQKKSLEVQYRSYFMLADSLKEAKESNAHTKQALEAMVKNSGLPDFVKLQNHELYTQLLKNKFANALTDRLFGTQSAVMKKVKENAGKAIQGAAGTLAGFVEQLSGMTEQMAMEKEMGMGGSFTELGAGIAADYGLDKAFKFSQDKLNKYDGNGKIRKTIKRGGHQLGFGARNGAALGKQWLDKKSQGSGPMAFLASLGVDLFKGAGGTDNKLEGAKGMREPAIFSHGNSRSLNEVIPGYLSRIFRELQVMRTGDTKIGLTSFDYKRGAFVTEKESHSSIAKLLGAKAKKVESAASSALQRMAANSKIGQRLGMKPDQARPSTTTDGILDYIDPSGKQLSRKAREELKKFMLLDRMNGLNVGSIDRYSNANTYQGLDPKTSLELAKAFQNLGGKKGSDGYVARNDHFNRSFQNLGSEIEDKREIVQELVHQGKADQLVALGVLEIDEQGDYVIDMARLIEFQTKSNVKTGGGGGADPTKSRGMPRAPTPSGGAAKAAAKKAPKVKVAYAKVEKAREAATAKVYRMSVPVSRASAQASIQQQPSIAANFPQFNETKLTETNEILMRLEHILLYRDFTVRKKGRGKAPVESSNEPEFFTGTGWLGAKGQRMAKRFSTGARKAGNSAIDFALRSNRTTMGILKNMYGAAKDSVMTTKDLLQSKYKDLYVKGDVEARLKSAKLRAGKYRDEATGKIIENWKDIKGAVRDLDTGELVLQAQEIKQTFMRSGPVRGLINVGKELSKWAVKTGWNSVGQTQALMHQAKNVIRGATEKIMGIIDGPGDVYVKGDSEPTLKAADMAAGKYRDKETGKVINKPSEVTGPVMKGRKMILTTADIAKGLVDEKGNKIRGLAGRIGFGLAGAAVKLYKRGKNMVTGVYNAFAKTLGAAGGVVANVLAGVGDAFGLNTWGKRNTEVLEKIYDLLDKRIPQQKNYKEGSWQKDMYVDDDFAGKKPGGRGRKDKEAGAEAKIKDRKNVIDQGLEKLKSIKDTIMDVFDRGGPDGKRGGRGAKGKVRGAARMGAKGVVGTITGLAKGAGSAALGLAKFGLGGVASAGVGLASGWGASKLASGLGASDGTADLIGTGVGIGTGLLGAGTVLGAVGSMVGGAAGLLGTALAGIGALISAPVVIGAVVAAAAAYGTYKLYKRLTKPTPLEAYRGAQYGFHPEQDTHINTVLHLEQVFQPSVKFEDGKATLDEKKLDIDQICNLFGFKADETKAKNAFAWWLQKRFKPVYLTHQTALNVVKSGTKLADVDKLSPEEKLKYLTLTVVDSGVYSEFTSPFPDLKHLQAGPKAVTKRYDEVKKLFEEDITKKAKSAEKSAADKLTATAAHPNAKAYDAATKGKNQSVGQAITSTFNDIMKSAGLLGKQVWEGLGLGWASRKVAAGVSWVDNTVSRYYGGSVEALEGARFRAYGAKDMDRMKVMNLRDLEEEMSRGLTINASGNCQWFGDPATIYEKLGGAFGVAKDKDLMESFGKWLMQRFLPVYSKYRGELFRYTNKDKQRDAEKAVKPEDAIMIAQAVIGMPVWNILFSPWYQYALNTDAASAKPNLEFLQNKAKDVKLNEQKTPVSSSKTKTAGDTVQTAAASKDSKAPKYEFFQQAQPDAEPAANGKASGGGSANTGGAVGKLTSAGGEMRDGAGAAQYLNAKNANLDGLNPEMRKLFFGMVQEYGELTGKKVGVNSAFRSMEQQAAEYKKDPTKAAKPGSSMHEYGLAVDVDSAVLNEMDKLGLMRKYGFTRPVGREPWHMEPAGIQPDYMGVRTNPSRASAAILAGVGKGGGGWGTDGQANDHSRNMGMARALLKQATDPKDAGDQSATAANQKTPTPGGAAGMESGSSVGAGASGAGNAGAQITEAGNAVARRGWRPGDEKPNNPASIVTNNPRTSASVGDQGSNNNLPDANVGSSGAYGKIADAKGATGWQAFKDMITGAAKAVGVPLATLAGLIGVESSFNPNARAGTSTAGGLGQFLAGTWREMMGKHSKRLGIPGNATQFDPKASALMSAQYIRDNLGNREVPATQAYMAHFLGPGGAKKFMAAGPTAIAAQVVPDAARSNPSIFYDGNRARTCAEVYQLLQKRLNDRMRQAGVDGSMMDTSTFGGAGQSSTQASTGGTDAGVASAGVSIGGGAGASAPQPSQSQARPASMTTFNDQGKSDTGFKPTAPTLAAEAPGSVTPGGTSQSAKTQPNQQADMVKSLTSVENILSQQLTVQQQILALMQGAMDRKTAEGGATESSSTPNAAGRPTATAPKVPVPMNRQRIQA